MTFLPVKGERVRCMGCGRLFPEGTFMFDECRELLFCAECYPQCGTGDCDPISMWGWHECIRRANDLHRSMGGSDLLPRPG